MYGIQHLNLLTSSKCDLQCKYCFLTKNDTFNAYDNTIIKAWEDGSYVQNIKHFFSILNSDPKDVTEISFWGGEPFLNIKNIIPGIRELNKYFPNIIIYHVPTNWVHTDTKKLCELLQNINDTSTPRTQESLIHFHIQMSIDGVNDDIFMQEGHQGSWNLYKKNFDDLYNQLQQMYLPNLSVDFCISSTGGQDTILKYFSKEENIQNHIKSWDKIVRYMQEKAKTSKNPSILINSLVNFPTVALPQESSIQDGFKLATFLRLVNYQLYLNNAMYRQQDSFARDYFNTDTLYPLTLANHECPEAAQFSVTLRPDGTICQCPDSFLADIKEYQNEILEKEGLLSYKQTLIAATHYFNPLTASKEDIEDHRWYTIMGGFKDTVFPYINLNFSLALELALSRQINYNYYQDPEMLLKHLTASSMINECFRDNVIVTGIPYLSGIGYLRRWLNGWVEHSFPAHCLELKKMLQDYIQVKIKKGKCNE